MMTGQSGADLRFIQYAWQVVFISVLEAKASKARGHSGHKAPPMTHYWHHPSYSNAFRIICTVSHQDEDEKEPVSEDWKEHETWGILIPFENCSTNQKPNIYQTNYMNNQNKFQQLLVPSDNVQQPLAVVIVDEPQRHLFSIELSNPLGFFKGDLLQWAMP